MVDRQIETLRQLSGLTTSDLSDYRERSEKITTLYRELDQIRRANFERPLHRASWQFTLCGLEGVKRRSAASNRSRRPLVLYSKLLAHRIGRASLAAKILMVLSASIILTLGVVHLVYTFWGPNLTPRDPALAISMRQTSPVITTETPMWRAWVGFNASHSMGLILFGLVFGYLALAHGQLLFRSPFLLVVGLAVLVGFIVLCKVYFFRAPLIGVSISLACYVASIAFSRA